MTSTAAVLALCRFALDAAALLLWGASAYLAWLVPRNLAVTVTARIEAAWTVAVAVAVGATLARLPVEAAAIGDGWRDGFDPTVVAGVLRGTSVGQAWAAQAVAAALLALVQAVPAPRRDAATALASGLLVASLSLGGHAVMHEGLIGLMHRINAVAHLLCAGAWLGALWPVVTVLGLLKRIDRRAEAVSALLAFSRAGHVAVALVLVSGAINTALVLGRWPTDLSSPYEALLDVKLLCVAGMAGLAIANRYLVVPRLGRRPAAEAALRRATLAEIALGFAVLALVGVFGLLDPV